MLRLRYILISFTIFLFFSCSSKKNILFLQDAKLDGSYDYGYSQYEIKVDDILKITISADNPDAAIPYNPTILSNNTNISKETLIYNGYIVDSEGFIHISNLDKIYVLGSTLSETKNLVIENLINSNLLTKPFVDVKLLNYNFTILGEVSRPGRYEYNKNNLNILEALGMAGDLTINGLRDDIKIIRDINGKKNISSVDLTKSDFLVSENYQIISGDIILVNPNSTRVKNAGLIGNSGTLLSLLSFLLSSIIVITR